MSRDPAKTQQLSNLISKVRELTVQGQLHWDRQLNSSHRYARWNNHLLILGPSDSSSETSAPRYLFITPFNSPDCIEINSKDEELGSAVLQLVAVVEAATLSEPPSDPFSLSGDILERLES